MSLSTTTSRVDYDGNGSTATFPYTFKIFAETELVVIETDASGVETTLTLNVNYTVTGVTTPGGSSQSGGNVVRTAGNLPTDYRWTIRRIRAIKQDTDIRNQGEYFPATIEDTFDKLVMILQQLNEIADRSLKLPLSISSADFDPTLPTSIEGSAERMLMVSATGVGFAIGPTPAELNEAGANVLAAEAAAAAAADSEANAAASETLASNNALTASRWAKQVHGTSIVDAVTGVDSGLFSALAYAQDAAASAASAASSGFPVSSPLAITDGQAATNLTGESYDGATYRQVDFFCSVRRGTTVMSSANFSLFYLNSVWTLVLGSSVGTLPHGVSFSLAAQVGSVTQLKAALDVGAGNGTIVLKKSLFAA